MKKYLNDEELNILNGYENKKLIVSESKDKDIFIAKKASQNTFEKKVVLSVELSHHDMENLKIKELETGIPRENIVSALIHRYLENNISFSV